VLSFEAGLHGYLKDKHATLLTTLENERAMSKESEAELSQAIGTFKQSGTY